MTAANVRLVDRKIASERGGQGTGAACPAPDLTQGDVAH
jgi:hypothetical protein